jgi:enoyl-CoA hydratase/carnithine racemase
VSYSLALSRCPRDQLDEEIGALAARIAQQPAAAVASSKRLLRADRMQMVSAASRRERAEAGWLSSQFGPPGSARPPA